MGVFNAVRKYVLLDDEHESSRETSAKADGIVVVGDGSTRTSPDTTTLRWLSTDQRTRSHTQLHLCCCSAHCCDVCASLAPLEEL